MEELELYNQKTFEDLKHILSQIDPAITVHDFRTVLGVC